MFYFGSLLLKIISSFAMLGVYILIPFLVEGDIYARTSLLLYVASVAAVIGFKWLELPIARLGLLSTIKNKSLRSAKKIGISIALIIIVNFVGSLFYFWDFRSIILSFIFSLFLASYSALRSILIREGHVTQAYLLDFSRSLGLLFIFLFFYLNKYVVDESYAFFLLFTYLFSICIGGFFVKELVLLIPKNDTSFELPNLKKINNFYLAVTILKIVWESVDKFYVSKIGDNGLAEYFWLSDLSLFFIGGIFSFVWSINQKKIISTYDESRNLNLLGSMCALMIDIWVGILLVLLLVGDLLLTNLPTDFKSNFALNYAICFLSIHAICSIRQLVFEQFLFLKDDRNSVYIFYLACTPLYLMGLFLMKLYFDWNLAYSVLLLNILMATIFISILFIKHRYDLKCITKKIIDELFFIKKRLIGLFYVLAVIIGYTDIQEFKFLILTTIIFFWFVVIVRNFLFPRDISD